MKICPVCGKPAKRIATHHVIPRYLEISSDDDVMECCISCHRKFDIKFKNLILWGKLKPDHWNNKEKEYLNQKRWAKNHPEKIKRARRKYREKKRLERGIKHRPKVTTRYPSLDILKKELYDLYWNQKLSIREMPNSMELTHTAIGRWMQRLNVPRRTQEEGCRNYHRRDKMELINKAEELKLMGLTCYKIAKKLNISKGQAWRFSHMKEACTIKVETVRS